MYNHSSHFSMSSFRCKPYVWLLLAVFWVSLIPSAALARQPTAMISALSGMVLVNGQIMAEGAILSTGDVLETQAGASVVLELSDGSILELGENTRLDITVLSQTATGARTSNVKLWWGRVRATLSAQHQQVGSNFDIETPNALVGVKFSQPDVEVIYDQVTQETTAFAYTVALWVTNLITRETVLVPIGSTAIITAIGIQVISGITAAGTLAPETAAAGATESAAAAGIGTTTIIAIGAGAVAALGGVAVLANGGGDGDGDGGDSQIPSPVGIWNGDTTYSYLPPGQYDPGVFTLEFQEGGSVIYRAGTEGRGDWTQNGSTISFHINKYSFWNGTIQGNTMSGDVYNLDGARGTWTAVRR